MNKFISCDWGTSSLRLRLADIDTQEILAEFTSQQGIVATDALWKNSSLERFLFYRSVLSQCIKKLSMQCGLNLFNVSVVVSGMASSGIGIKELEYKTLPVNANGIDFSVHTIDPESDFQHKLIIISGLKSSKDVMRGEETIIAGCDIKSMDGEQLFILPGTHSKHISIKKGMITGVKTFMTGELFDLLSTKSILSASVETGNSAGECINPHFEKAVKEGASGNLLNSIFHIRTNQLFHITQPGENYYYLSGLLIGSELKDLAQNHYNSITLVSDKKFEIPYIQALLCLGMSENIHYIDANMALVKGQSIIYKHYQ